MQTFLERLDGEARDLLLAVARPVAHAKGERLVRYGDPSRGAYLLKEGSCRSHRHCCPAAKSSPWRRLDAGGVFGEMALIERGTCTATVTASEKLEGWFIERDDFRSLVAQRVPAALRVQHALTLALSEKLRQLNAKVLEVAAARRQAQIGVRRTTPIRSPGVKRSKQASFDFGPSCRTCRSSKASTPPRSTRSSSPAACSSCRAATTSSPPASRRPPASSSSAAR